MLTLYYVKVVICCFRQSVQKTDIITKKVCLVFSIFFIDFWGIIIYNNNCRGYQILTKIHMKRGLSMREINIHTLGFDKIQQLTNAELYEADKKINARLNYLNFADRFLPSEKQEYQELNRLSCQLWQVIRKRRGN